MTNRSITAKSQAASRRNITKAHLVRKGRKEPRQLGRRKK